MSTGRPGIKEFSTGARRSSDADAVRLDLISPILLLRVALAYAEGAKKYPPGNYLKGMPASEILNHALLHMLSYMLGDRSEDHLGHLAWNIGTLMHFEMTRPDMMDLVDYKLSPEHVKAVLNQFSPHQEKVAEFDYKNFALQAVQSIAPKKKPAVRKKPMVKPPLTAPIS